MRSPSMRHASLHPEDKSPSHVSNERRPSSPFCDIPQYITDDTTSTDFRDFYWTVQDDRQRQLRLLIRRYVNQIQYGCHDRNCTVPTCLSFRKRSTKGPLRVYTDLSARALACHLVEERSQTGKDPYSGLCQSRPVVAWYEDRHLTRYHEKRTRPLVSSKSNENDLEPKSPPANRATGERNVKRVTHDGIGQNAARRKCPVDAQKSWTGSTFASTAETRTEPSRDDREPPQCPPDDVTPAQREQDDAAPPAQKKDLSSFVQSLWDTVSLRKLQPKPDTGTTSSQSSDEPHMATVRQMSHYRAAQFDLQDPKDGLNLTSTATCGFTLRRLSWKTLKWLVDVRTAFPELSGTPFEVFLRQSLYYCLSNPRRLYESTKSWNSDRDGDEQDDEIQDESKTKPRDRDFQETSTTDEMLPKMNLDLHRHSKDHLSKFDINRSLEAFDMLETLNEGIDQIYEFLHRTLQQCYTIGLPRSSSRKQQQGLKSLKRSGGGMRKVEVAVNTPAAPTMNKNEVAEVFLSVLMACLMPLFSEDLADAGFDPVILGSLADMRNDNRAYPVVVYGSTVKDLEDTHLRQLLIKIVDHFEDWHLLRLTTSLMDCLSHHLAATAIRRNQKPFLRIEKISRNVLEILLDRLCAGLPPVECPAKSAAEIEFRAVIGLGIVELARSVLLKEWDREPVVRRTSAVGGALELLAAVFRRNHFFFVGPSLFYMPFIAQAFDEMEMPVQWQAFQPNGKDVHILSFSFLFEPATLIKYFRSVNVNAMRRAHENAAAYSSDARQFLGNTVIPVYGGKEVLAALRPHMARYLVLTIRRSNILEDAINQLWRRQRREILRPLRVRLGKDEGEDGLDHGGVQQEFFRLVFAEAFRPDYGMFTVDGSTQMTWFQPGSLEPLYKFEALGILMSLAVYNAVTLPITFPLAFYRKLLGLKVKKLDHIKDGWPDLSRGLEVLLDYEGDVAETITRTYEFSYEFSGSTVSIDIEKHGRDEPWPVPERISRKGKEKVKSTSFELPVQLDITPPSQSPPTGPLSRTSSLKGITTPLSLESETLEGAATVTNETREQYVKDYVFWLTDKSIQPQFDAFARGFFTCLDSTALSMFTPEALQEVMEGHRHIDIDDLERTATYEEYEKTSDYIEQFWQVVRNFTQQQHRNLLEFVTASDRVPVNGLESIQFIVQKNGDDDSRLPSSSTCYGRLLLPQYSSKEILIDKLSKALENSLGFGAL